MLYDSEDFFVKTKTIAELFSVETNTINYHLKEIFNSVELGEDAVIRKIWITDSSVNFTNRNNSFCCFFLKKYMLSFLICLLYLSYSGSSYLTVKICIPWHYFFEVVYITISGVIMIS